MPHRSAFGPIAVEETGHAIYGIYVDVRAQSPLANTVFMAGISQETQTKSGTKSDKRKSRGPVSSGIRVASDG